jgi:signal transduction histidine kinase
MRRVPIRLKLAATLAVPLAALVVVITFEVADSIGEAREVREQTELAQATTGPDGLINALQVEGRFATAHTVGLEAAAGLPVADNGEARRATDRALEEFQRQTERGSGRVRAAYRPVLRELTGLDELRSEVDAYDGSRTLDAGLETGDEIFQRYADILDGFFDANGHIALAVDDPELRTGTNLINLAARQVDIGANLTRAVIFGQLTGSGLDDRAEIARVASVLADYDAGDDAIRRTATGAYRPIASSALRSDRLTRYRSLIASAIQSRQLDVTALLDANTSGGDSEYVAFRDRAAGVLADKADSLNRAAAARERWFVSLGTLVLVAAFVGTWLVSRSITRPLRSLTVQATDMAEHRLPEAVLDILERPLGENVTVPDLAPLEHASRDEVADVTQALNTVQRVAVDLAVEQAVLRRNIADSFVNLGRRNQNLLARQLDFITQLESNETDADTLASLFRLDHLATRMRRNAESLLVLAGIEPPRKWTAPVRLTDVIRSALGEVEDYQRVTVHGVEPASLLGSAATDLAHLLAELIDNALAFSPPDQPVRIMGRATAGGYTLAVLDGGPGMTSDDIERANRRLGGGESFTVAPSKYLGHYVAGHLAARHGIAVRIESPWSDADPGRDHGRGLAVAVTLPPTLLAAAPAPAGDTAAGSLPAATPTSPTPYSGTAPGRAPSSPTTQASPAAPATFPAPAWTADPAVAAASSADPSWSAPAAGSGDRTRSGLVKRSADGAAGSVPPPRAPSEELLAALSRHTANLRDQPPPEPPAGKSTARLARRVPGAQRPDTTPPRLSRRSQRPPTPGAPHSADDVYSFLTNFSSGVQHGLDRTRPNRHPDGGWPTA